MADEADAALDAGPETAPQQAEPQANAPTATEPTDLNATSAPEEDGGDEPVEEFEDFEHDGKAYKVPKPLVRHLMRDKDYSEKSAANAELRRTLESQRAEIEARSKATEEELDMRAGLRFVSHQLAEYEKLTPQDWQAHLQQDPLAVQQAQIAFQSLQRQKAELEARLKDAETKRSESAKQEAATRAREAFSEAAKLIPGWTPETAKKTLTDILSYAKERGVPQQFLQSNMSGTLLAVLNEARIGRQLLQKQTAPKSLPPAAPAPPLATVTGKSSPGARVNLASADMESYVAARKRGVGGKPSVR